MIHIGLFEGIGGFSLAASHMGWKTLVTCEINPFGQRVLKYYWPNAYHHADIKTLNYDTINSELSNRFGEGWRNDDIIITGGFPCQPYSLAGKRLGTADDRHLWPEMLRIIREVQPTWVVGENVFGLINWNGGLVFDEVQTDLETEGYEVQPYVLPAASVNAPHKRDRVWFIAHRANSRAKEMQHPGENGIYGFKTTPNANSRRQSRKKHREKKPGWITETGFSNYWEDFPTKSPVCLGDDGISSRLLGITFSKWRNESIKAMGNAIVPQVALEIFKVIQQMSK